MAHYYYLMNGKKGYSNALNLLVDGKLIKNFNDISDLDLQTMNIFSQEKRDILSEYNKKVDLSGMFYDASYPHNKTEVKTYAPIFNYLDEYDMHEMRYCYDSLNEFASERSFNRLRGKSVKLCDSKKLDNYIHFLLKSIMKNRLIEFTNYECLCSAKLKDIIREKFSEYDYMSTDNFLEKRKIIIKNLLSNYTELRNLTIEYLLYLDGKSINVRSHVSGAKKWDNKGMGVVEPINYVKGMEISKYEEPKQITLGDFSSELNKSRQYTLFDYNKKSSLY